MTINVGGTPVNVEVETAIIGAVEIKNDEGSPIPITGNITNSQEHSDLSQINDSILETGNAQILQAEDNGNILEAIQGILEGTLQVDPGPAPTDYPDVASANKLEQIRLLLAALPTTAPQTNALTDTQLRANPVTVTVSNPTAAADNGTATTSPPSSGTGIIGWLRGIYDKTEAVRNLLANPLTVTGTVTTSGGGDATAANQTLQNTKLDTIHTDLSQVVVAEFNATKAATGIGAIIDQQTSKGIELEVELVTTTFSGTLLMQGSNDGTNWYSLLGYQTNTSVGAVTQGPPVNASVALANQSVRNVFRYSNQWKYWRAYASPHTNGTITVNVREFANPSAWPAVVASASNFQVIQGTGSAGNAWYVVQAGSLAAVTSFSSITSASLKVSNPSRREIIIENTSNVDLYILYGTGTVSTTSFTKKIAAGATWIEDNYTGAIVGICASAPTGQIQVTEITV